MLLLPFVAFSLLLAPSASPSAPTAYVLPPTTTSIDLHCPATAKFVCGAPTDPAHTGFATATTSCSLSPDVTITYSDAPGPSTNCPADRFHAIVLRTWTATDACGNSQSCTQELHILRQIWSLDALPATCPNVMDTDNGPSTVTFAITGALGQNVANIVPASVRVYTEQCAAGPVTPAHVSLADVARPFAGAVCACTSLGADGMQDMKLDFNRTTLVNGLHLGALAAGAKARVIVTGALADGCTFIALDCLQISHSSGDQGCSLGYWKNHLSAWGPTGFNPTDDFDTVFGVDAFNPNRTLLQALQAGGGGINNLGRQGVAALLSASHPGIHFPMTMAQVITTVHDAVLNGTAGTVASQLDVLVNAGCPLN